MWAERSEAGGAQQRLSLYDGHDAAIALIFISFHDVQKQKIEQLTEKESLSARAEQRLGRG